jgi:hypothetical protein
MEPAEPVDRPDFDGSDRVGAPSGDAPKMVEIDAGDTVWRFEPTFMRSNWTCIWGRGCQGILEHPAPELGQGCCSVGAELADEDEAMLIGALGAALEPDRFEHHAAAASGGVYAEGGHGATRVVDGACIFLNRPGFAGGGGCALHLAALDVGEAPLDWKPSVCWQLPVRVEWERLDEQREQATVRRWSRADWGDEGETMAWCCTEGSEAYVAGDRVVDSLGQEIAALTGTEVYVELRRRLGPG